MDDAPPPYIAGQLRAIVGVEVVIDRVEGKWKLIQNRSDADIARTIESLEATGENSISAAMRELGRGPTAWSLDRAVGRDHVPFFVAEQTALPPWSQSPASLDRRYSGQNHDESRHFRRRS